MQADAYKLGYLDAALDFGLSKEAYVKAIAPVAAGILGGIAAPEGETMQGVALGAGGALALQSVAGAGMKRLAGPKTPAAPVAPAPPPGGTTVLPKGGPVPMGAIPQKIHEIAHDYSVDPQELHARRLQQVSERVASLEEFKIAVDVSAGVSLPVLGGASLGFKDQRERLPGMSRWVPRSTVERGFDYADEGLDSEAVSDIEGDRGSITHPLLGAALAAAGARKFMPQSGALGPLLAGLGGAGLGTLYNKATKDRRIEEGLEAHSGAQREREKFPIRRHPTQTANESTPLAVSRGNGDA